MAIERRDLGAIMIGSGLLAVGGYFIYREWQKNRLIAEFLDKVARAEAAYVSAIDRGDYAEAERILEFYEATMRHEEEVIKEQGFLETLVDSLAKLGYIVIGIYAGMIAYEIVKHIITRRPPPPPYQCPHCGEGFHSVELLEQHVRERHPVNEPAVPEGEAAYRTLPSWARGLVTSFSGVKEWMLEESWGGLAHWQIIALAAAAIVILVLAWWASPAVVAALGKIAAMARVAPI